MDYCLPLSSDLNLQNPDLQCQFNRTGVLCSQCQHSLSMVFGSSWCIHCTNHTHSHQFSDSACWNSISGNNLSSQPHSNYCNGTITGIIFYANGTFLTNDNIFKPLRVFISFLNLDLGVETRFYNGMDSYIKIFFQLFFPLYIITIAILIIVISHYSSYVLRWTYSKSSSVLATLLLLSYSGTLRTVSTILFFYSTIVQLPSSDQWLVWSVDASVKLFGSKFIILFITCLLMLLLLITFNVLLFVAPYLSKFSLMYHFKPLLDAFQGPLKHKYYYWIGVTVAFLALFLVLQAVPTRMKLIM